MNACTNSAPAVPVPFTSVHGITLIVFGPTIPGVQFQANGNALSVCTFVVPL